MVLCVMFRRFLRVMFGVSTVTLSHMRVVCCLLVITRLVVLSGFLMMCGCMTEMFGRFFVMFSCFVSHLVSSQCEFNRLRRGSGAAVFTSVEARSYVVMKSGLMTVLPSGTKRKWPIVIG